MTALGGLALLASLTLSDEKIRAVTLALLALFAVRTWLTHRKQQQEAADDARKF